MHDEASPRWRLGQLRGVVTSQETGGSERRRELLTKLKAVHDPGDGSTIDLPVSADELRELQLALQDALDLPQFVREANRMGELRRKLKGADSSTRAELLPKARLKRHHRHRCSVLEVELSESGAVARLLFGIVRHPKAHPLAPRGDEVLELIEYRPAAGSLANVGSRNLTRRPVG